MTTQGPTTKQLQDCLDQLRSGDESARDRLIEHACKRLRRLTRQLKQDFPIVCGSEQTDDVFQQAGMRLYGSLRDIQPENVRAFLGLAATQIRRELLDLARKIRSAQGLAKSYSLDAFGADADRTLRYEPAHDTAGPVTLLLWTEFHRHAGQLPDDEREVFNLLYYQGLSQAEAAELLSVSERTIKRRWRSAKLILHEVMNGEIPGP